MKVGTLTIAALAAAALFPATAHAAAPANDAFRRARPVDTMPYEVTLRTAGATLERGETQPACAPAFSTVWFRFRMRDRLPLTISTLGSSYDTVVTVYTGSRVDRLQQVACDDDAGTRNGSVLGWDAEPGTYHIQVASAGAQGGTLKMRLYVGAHRSRGPDQSFNLSTPFQVVAVPHPSRVDIAAEADVSYCINSLCVWLAGARADAERTPTTAAGTQNACVIAAGRVSTCPY